MLGQLVDLVKPEEVLHHVQTAVAEGRKTIVANHNLHSLYLIQKNPEMRAFYAQAEMVEVDSTPMIWFSRTLGLHSRGFHRCTYLDWRAHFWSVANRRKWRIAYVGGEPGVSETAAERLNAVYPDAQILPRHGFFDASAGSADNAALIADIMAFNPQIRTIRFSFGAHGNGIAKHSMADLAAGLLEAAGTPAQWSSRARPLPVPSGADPGDSWIERVLAGEVYLSEDLRK